MTYPEWLLHQAPVRRAASLRHMRVCRLLGKANRRYPMSLRAEKLRSAVRSYYHEFPE